MVSLFSLFFFFALLASTSLSAPAQTVQEREPYGWSPTVADFHSAVGKRTAQIRDLADESPCDLSNASMPVAPIPLPGPGPGQVLRHVAIGRGTQNYTCASASASLAPVAIGALASLYNASCIAATYPDLLATLPNMALQIPLPPGNSPLDLDNIELSNIDPSDISLSGYHYFSDPTTPTFNLDTIPPKQYGFAVAKKVASSPAPADAPKGPGGVGNGSVPWLYLQCVDGTTGGLTAVYRLNTAGGSPPTSCEGMPVEFTVQYAAEYWFWGDPLSDTSGSQVSR